MLLCCVIAFLDGADAQALAVVAPAVARELAIPPGSLGAVFSCGLLGAAVGAAVCGSLADRWGARRMLAACTAIFGALQAATSYADSLENLLVLRFLAGLGLGGATPCFLALASSSVPRGRRTRLLALVWAFFPLGAFVGGFLNGWIAASTSWRVVFVVGGIPPLVVAALLASVRAEPTSGTAGADGPGAPMRSGLLRLAARDPVLARRCVLLCCVFFGAFGTLAGIVVWMPSMLAGQGFSLAQGGMILSVFALGALISMASAGVLIERWGPSVLAIGLGAAAVVLWVQAPALSSLASVGACTLLLGICLGVSAAGGVALAASVFPPEAQASGLGIAMAVGRIGQVVLPFAMGIGLHRQLASGAVLACSATLPLLACIAAVALVRSMESGKDAG